MRIILVFAAGIVVVTSLAMVRYPVGRAVPEGIYTAPIDPNGDPIHKMFGIVPDNWGDRLGYNERTLFAYKIWTLQDAIKNLNTRQTATEKALKEAQESIKTMLARVFGNEGKILVCQICEPWSGDPNDSVICPGHGIQTDRKWVDPNEPSDVSTMD